jgi:acetolactate synthase I/II/III large subunit
MNAAERVAQVLRAFGIERAYGIPGEDHMELLGALARAGIDYVTACNESAAVIMAATEAAVTGVPGLAVLSLSPGVSNGVNGILHSSMEHLPVIIVSGSHPADREPFLVRQAFDVANLLRPMVRWSTRLVAGADPERALCKAVEVATGEPGGPVYVEMAVGVATAELGELEAPRAAATVANGLDRSQPAALPAISDGAAAELAARLQQASRPVLVVGGRRASLRDGVTAALAAAYHLPVLVTPGQKGCMPPDHPYFAGTFLNGSLEGSLLRQSDLVVAIDLDPFDIYNRPIATAAPVVSVAPHRLTDWLFELDTRLVGDVDLLFRGLISAAPARPGSAWTSDDVSAYRRMVHETLLDAPADEEGLSVPIVIEEAVAAASDDAVLVADAGFSKPIITHLFHPIQRGSFYASNGLSTMGFAIPAAMALARAGTRPVLAFMGDGSFLMRATELAMLPRSDRSPVFVVIVDGSLTQIHVKQERGGLDEVGVALPPVSCERYGAALGIPGVDVASRDDLSTALKGAWADGNPLLIGAHVSGASTRRLFEALRG